MTNNPNNDICPVEKSGTLDNIFRRILQNPQKILASLIEEGMTALDVGCGPGFFTIDMAKLVGDSGQVIAADLQDGMLDKVREKISGTKLESRISLHRCLEDKIGVTESVDFVLLFYLVHEVPDQLSLFRELDAILKPEGKILIVEPPFHVSKEAFKQSIKVAGEVGFSEFPGPRVFLSKSAILKRST